MSFLGGAECSTSGNPLTQFTKHVQNDNTLQRDRLVGRGPGGLEEGIRSRVAPNGSDQVCPCGALLKSPLTPSDDERLPTIRVCSDILRHGAYATGLALGPFSDTTNTFTWLGSRISPRRPSSDGSRHARTTHGRDQGKWIQRNRFCTLSTAQPRRTPNDSKPGCT